MLGVGADAGLYSATEWESLFLVEAGVSAALAGLVSGLLLCLLVAVLEHGCSPSSRFSGEGSPILQIVPRGTIHSDGWPVTSAIRSKSAS